MHVARHRNHAKYDTMYRLTANRITKTNITRPINLGEFVPNKRSDLTGVTICLYCRNNQKYMSYQYSEVCIQSESRFIGNLLFCYRHCNQYNLTYQCRKVYIKLGVRFYWAFTKLATKRLKTFCKVAKWSAICKRRV